MGKIVNKFVVYYRNVNGSILLFCMKKLWRVLVFQFSLPLPFRSGFMLGFFYYFEKFKYLIKRRVIGRYYRGGYNLNLTKISLNISTYIYIYTIYLCMYLISIYFHLFPYVSIYITQFSFFFCKIYKIQNAASDDTTNFS